MNKKANVPTTGVDLASRLYYSTAQVKLNGHPTFQEVGDEGYPEIVSLSYADVPYPGCDGAPCLRMSDIHSIKAVNSASLHIIDKDGSKWVMRFYDENGPRSLTDVFGTTCNLYSANMDVGSGHTSFIEPTCMPNKRKCIQSIKASAEGERHSIMDEAEVWVSDPHGRLVYNAVLPQGETRWITRETDNDRAK